MIAKVTSLKPPTSAGDCESDLGREAALLRVAGEHLVEVAGEQRRLVAAGPGADLDDHVLVVVGVALDHRQADLLLELLEPRRRLGDHRPQLRVVAVLGEQLPGALEVVAAACATRAASSLRRLELAVLAPDLGVALAVGDHLGVGHLPLELGEAALDLLDELLDHARLRRQCDGLGDDLDRLLGGLASGVSTASTASSAAIATASCSSSGSRVVRFCSIRPGHISARTQRLRRFLPAHLITS